MSNISSWTTSAASNNSASPDGFPEGMNPSGLNDSAREVMGAVRRWYVDAEWINHGDVLVRQTANSFLVSRTATDVYTAGRRLKLYDTTTILGEVLSSGPSGANTLVTVSSSSLTSSLSSGAVSILNPQYNSIPGTSGQTLTSPVINTAVTGTALATQAQQETGTATNVLVTTGMQQYHPSAAKGWVVFNSAGTVAASYNVSSVAKNSTGNFTVNWGTDFSSANFCVVAMGRRSDGTNIVVYHSGSPAAGASEINSISTSNVQKDADSYYVVAFGDQ